MAVLMLAAPVSTAHNHLGAEQCEDRALAGGLEVHDAVCASAWAGVVRVTDSQCGSTSSLRDCYRLDQAFSGTALYSTSLFVEYKDEYSMLAYAPGCVVPVVNGNPVHCSGSTVVKRWHDAGFSDCWQVWTRATDSFGVSAAVTHCDTP